MLNEPVDARLLLDGLRPRDKTVQSEKHLPIARG
jgi:hypothetical protein